VKRIPPWASGKIARTIADLEGEGAITPAHVAEAIQYRTMDRKFG
jgi:magnesium chelatase family protein